MGINALYMAGRSRILMVLAVTAVAASALFAVSAQAAPPLPDACISLAGCPSASAAAATGVSYGDSVQFDYSMSGKMAKNYYLTIVVECRQDGERVYKRAGQPDTWFHLANQGGNMWHWLSGDADCTAYLRYFANNRLSIVATTDFVATYGES